MNVNEYLTDTFMSSENKFTLQYWEIYVCNDTFAAFHNNFKKIIEIYVPELNLSINECTNPINVFISSKDRYSSEDNWGHKPKLIQTIKIYHDSETGKALKWLADFYREKKEKENKLIKLFNQPNNSL